MHPLLEAVFAAFERVGVPWCVLRGETELAAPMRDVDLLVEHTALGRLHEALEPLGFVQLPARRQTLRLHYVGYHRSTDRWIWLHIVADLSFGPNHLLQTGAEVECLTRRRYHGTVATLASDDAFWTLLLHCLLDKTAIASRHRVRLQELAGEARTDRTLAQTLGRLCPNEWTPARIIDSVRSGDWTALDRLAPSLKAACTGGHSRSKWRMLADRVVGLMDRVLTIPRRWGVSIAILGPDGAGKTTLATGLEESFIFPVRTIYMGLTGGYLPLVDRLRVPGLVFLGRICIFWGRYLRAQYHQARGRMVVFERYIYDAAVPHPQRLSPIRCISRRLSGYVCPGPHLVLVLNVPGEVMYERKRQYSPELLDSWRQSFLALGRRIPRLEVVDANRPQDVVRADVVDRIWRQYRARWSRS